jgi:hyperosmotically inducible protein
MKVIKSLIITAIVASIAITGCKPKDADIKAALETSIASVPSLAGTTVDVKEGVATLNGALKDETAKALAETTAKGIKGVKSVSNMITVTVQAKPVTIAVDDLLSQTLKDAVKDYPTVVASVKDGVVNLTGTIQKSSLPKLLMAISALKPKKIDNKLTIK